MQGLLGDRARDWRAQIIEAEALIEAGIDFADEGDVPTELIAPIRQHRARFRSQLHGDKWIAADYAVSTFDILTSVSFGVNVPNMSPRVTPN